MAQYLVVEGCELRLKTYHGTETIEVNPLTSIMSNKVKCKGKKVFKTIGFTVSGASNGTINAATGTGIINGNSIKTNADGIPLVLKDAESILVVLTGQGGSFTDSVVIFNAGQSRAMGK